MCQEILLIKNIYDRYVNLLIQYLLPQSVNIVEEYMDGFITFGQLQNDTIISRDFDKNYISFQIKYIHNLYFFDFWHVDDHDYGGDMFSKNWYLCHYSYIYKNGKLLSYKRYFIIDDSPGCIKCFNPSYYVYDLKKLKNKYFIEFTCSQQWIQNINNIPLDSKYSCEMTDELFKLFYNLTETRNKTFYKKHQLFNLS